MKCPSCETPLACGFYGICLEGRVKEEKVEDPEPEDRVFPVGKRKKPRWRVGEAQEEAGAQGA